MHRSIIVISVTNKIAISPFQILYLRFIERVGKGIRTAPRDSLVAGSSQNGEYGRSFGFHKAMDNCGAILGLIAGILYDKINSRVPFYFGSSTALLAAVLMIIFYKGKLSLK